MHHTKKDKRTVNSKVFQLPLPPSFYQQINSTINNIYPHSAIDKLM